MEHGRSPGATLIELPGVEAVAFPACPRMWLFNAVFAYEGAGALAEALPELDRRFASLGVRSWSATTADHDLAASRALAENGYRSCFEARRMGGFMAVLDLEARAELELVPEPTWETIAYCNDRAYGVSAAQGILPALRGLDDPAIHLYAAAQDGAPIVSAITREQDGDCYMWFTATVPEARRRGLALELVRHAFREARARGCGSACGESTPMAEGLYAAVGGIPLGTAYTWVRGA